MASIELCCPRCRKTGCILRIHCQGTGLDLKDCRLKGCHVGACCQACELQWVERCGDHGIGASTVEQLKARA